MRSKTRKKKYSAILLAFGATASVYGALTAEASGPSAARTIDVKVTVVGYEPAQIKVSPNEKITLRVTRVTDATCATDIVVPDLKVKKDLPLNEPVLVDLGVLKQGQYAFGCGMSLMINGLLTVGTPDVKEPYRPKDEKSAKPVKH